MAGWIKMSLCSKEGLDPSNIVLDGNSAPLPKKKAQPPQFSAHVCCSQTAGWIKVPLGTMVGFGQGNSVFYADPAPPQGTQPKIFGPRLLWPNGRSYLILLSTC